MKPLCICLFTARNRTTPFQPDGITRRGACRRCGSQQQYLGSKRNRRFCPAHRRALVEYLRRRNGMIDGRSQNAFGTDYRDSQGNVWHCEIVWHSGADVVRYMNLPPGTQPARIAFNTLFEDREGNIWLSTDGQGLYRVRTQTIQVLSKEHGLPDSNVYPIYQSRDEAIWIGTWTAGLTQVKDGKFTTYTTADGLASNRVTAIAEDRDGVLWVATYNGLHRMRNGRFDSVSTNGIFRGIPAVDAAIRVIHQDPAGVMWVGSDRRSVSP